MMIFDKKKPVFPCLDAPKIIPRIFGGLGNQLFIYAAARRLALVNNAELILDDVSGFARDHDYRRHSQLEHFHILCRKATPAERMEPLSWARRYLKRRINKRLPFEERNYIQQEGFDFEPRLLVVKPRGTVYLEGYWQSEYYFKDVEATIRQDLQIRPPADAVNLAMAEEILSRTAVAVHVRFFDEPEATGINNPPADYYIRAVAEMGRCVPDAHFYLFSDRPEAARARIPLSNDRVTTVSHNKGDVHAFADLWLMTLCRHFIIANSTFSWWGAWLAARPDKKVIAPGFVINDPQRITSWNFLGQVPAHWTRL